MTLDGGVVSFDWSIWFYFILSLGLLFAFQYFTLLGLNKKNFQLKKLIYSVYTLGLISVLSFNVIHIWASAYGERSVMMTKPFLPLFFPATANRFMRKNGFVDEEAIKAYQASKIKLNTGTLKYPINPIKTQKIENTPNIIIICIDSWRFDTFNKKNTPNIYNFFKDDSVSLENHMSSGNSTRTGIFGLFYGLHGTYWHSFLENRRSPIFIDRLQELGYQTNIFVASQLTSPEFDKTIYKNIKPLRPGSSGSTKAERDANLTKDWIQWHKSSSKKSKPLFSFLLFESAHGYDFPKDYPIVYKPSWDEINYFELDNSTDPTEFFNRYKNSVHYTDSLVKKILDTLKETKSLENTLIIVTGDHGQELNDNKLNFWGHNGNFTDVQVKVPMLLKGPAINSDGFKHLKNYYTSHVDVAPTLLRNYLGVLNPANDFSTGLDLLGSTESFSDRKWIFASNYSKYALITKKTILEVDSKTGLYQFMNKANRPLEEEIDLKTIKEAMIEMTKFKK